MGISFKFYFDAALTQEITVANPLPATQDTAGVLGPVDTIIYLGSTLVGNKAQDSVSPGVNPVVVSIADADVATGAPANEFKLALSAGGLDTAVAGDPLSLSTSILSGIANAVPIYTRRDSALLTAGLFTDITVKTQTLLETPV